MAKPGGYRKALRLMQHADRFSLPILTFIDTPGAYAGLSADAASGAFAASLHRIDAHASGLATV